MSTRIKLPSGREATRVSNGRGRGFRFEFGTWGVDEIVTLTEADVAALAGKLPLCDKCGSYKAECICGETITGADYRARYAPDGCPSCSGQFRSLCALDTCRDPWHTAPAAPKDRT